MKNNILKLCLYCLKNESSKKIKYMQDNFAKTEMTHLQIDTDYRAPNRKYINRTGSGH